MSILIKGMKMPKNCDSCDLIQFDDEELEAHCPLSPYYRWCGTPPDYIPEGCRLVEIPTPAHWIRHTPDKNIMQEFHKQGIECGMSESSIFWTCSNCGGWGNLSFNYCPSCGAKIEEAEQALKLKERENNA